MSHCFDADLPHIGRRVFTACRANGQIGHFFARSRTAFRAPTDAPKGGCLRAAVALEPTR